MLHAMIADAASLPTGEGIGIIGVALGLLGNLGFWLRWERRMTTLETKVDIIASNIGLYEYEALNRQARRKQRPFEGD